MIRIAWAFVVILIFACSIIGTLLDDLIRAFQRCLAARSI